MSKLKIGDKVRIAKLTGESKEINIGDKGVIISLNDKKFFKYQNYSSN